MKKRSYCLPGRVDFQIHNKLHSRQSKTAAVHKGIAAVFHSTEYYLYPFYFHIFYGIFNYYIVLLARKSDKPSYNPGYRSPPFKVRCFENRTLKIEYTVFKYKTCAAQQSKRKKNGAIHIYGYGDKRYLLTRLWQTGRDDTHKHNDTFSRPHTDLMGSPCGMRVVGRAVWWGYETVKPTVA